MKKWSCLVAFAILSSGVADARDHQELVCAGVAPAPKGGGDQMPVFIHFFESRNKDGSSRDEVLSTIYQGKLFKSSSVNKAGNLAKDAAFALKAAAATHIKGKYTVEQKGDAYSL